MSGLIGGILRGTGQTLQQIGAKNTELNIEAEKAAAQEARQLRLIEVQQQYAVQNRAADQEFQLGKTTLESQLRDQQLTKELEFRAAEGDKDRQSRREAAAIGRAPSPLSEAEQIELDLKKKRIEAIRNGDEEAVKMYDRMIGAKGEKPSLTVLGEDPTSGAKQYGIFDSSGSIVRVPVRDPFAPANSAPQSGPMTATQRAEIARQNLKAGTQTEPVQAQPSTPSPQQSYQRAPDGGNRNDVNKAYNAGIQNALKAKSQEIVAAERKGDVQAVMKLNQEYQQLQKSMK